MYVKTEFKTTGIYHIAIGILGILFAFAIAFYFIKIGNMASIEIAGMTTSDNIIDFVFVFPRILIGALFIYLGIKAKKANRYAILALIILNGLQIINFDLGQYEYQVLFGPYFQINVFDWTFGLGIKEIFRMDLNSFTYSEEPRFFNVNFIHLTISAYLIDQIRFIPK